MRLTYAFALLVLASPSLAVAQSTDSVGYYFRGLRLDRTVAPTEKDTTERDPLAASLFPPELIMAHQREIDLQDSQRAAITTEIQKAETSFIALQWKMNAETERLDSLLKPSAPNEMDVLQQVDRTLAVEREIKRVQVALLVRIKNTLTAAQQAKLIALRNEVPRQQLQIRNN